jgi:RNA polymerase sigma-70 factor (ECF subfamily)
MDVALEDWFAREILSHEAALTRYIAHVWANPSDVQDLRQEVYTKVLEAAEKARPLAPRFFMFTLAKNLMIDRARRNRIVPIDLLQDVDSLNVLIDEVSPERRAGSFQQLAKLVEAFDRLPPRCREVVWLRKIEDVPQKTIAERLKIAEGTVELHLVRGMKLLTQFFYGGATGGESAVANKRSQDESQHGK